MFLAEVIHCSNRCDIRERNLSMFPFSPFYLRAQEKDIIMKILYSMVREKEEGKLSVTNKT